jgi:hypothetical protein
LVDDGDVTAPQFNEGPAPWIRWLAVPYALLVVIVAALALSAESRDSFVERQGDGEAIERLTTDEIPFDATRIIIQTPDGAVEITTDGDRIVGEDSSGQAQVLRLVEDPDGNIVGFRVEADGTFSPVRVGEDTEGATLLVPNADGSFDLIKPDGTRVQVAPDGNGGVAAGEFGENGFTPLDRNDDGSFRLDDDLFASPTESFELDEGATPSAEASDSSSPGSFPWNTILIALAAAAALGLGIWFFMAYSPKVKAVGEVPVDQFFAAAPMMRREVASDPWAAFEEYLTELLHEPDPSQAILLAFSYVEAGVSTIPARIAEETPYEWFRRVQTADADSAPLIQPLLERYVAIRFGGHVAEDPERRRAVDDLRAIVYSACGAPDRLTPA